LRDGVANRRYSFALVARELLPALSAFEPPGGGAV
jgi:hypothetical protein